MAVGPETPIELINKVYSTLDDFGATYQIEHNLVVAGRRRTPRTIQGKQAPHTKLAQRCDRPVQTIPARKALPGNNCSKSAAYAAS